MDPGKDCALTMGKSLNRVELPAPEIDTPINPDTENWIKEIMEDSNGNMWIAKGGHGAYKINGTEITHFTKKDGLHSNSVTEIV